MDQNLAIFLTIGVISVVTFTFVFSQEFFKYRLKKEQIKADALVKAEEVRARNMVEIEKMTYQKQNDLGNNNTNIRDNFIYNETLTEKRNMEKKKL